jgi:hypothetical protein
MRRRRLFLFLLAAVLVLTTAVLGEAYFLTLPHSAPSESTSLNSTTFSMTTSVTVSPVEGQVEETYVTSSPPNSSQWLIVRSNGSPVSVSANDTGLIPEYKSLEVLNQTKIGVYCVSVDSSGACSSFQQYLETGWFWNSSNQILYVHYVGGSAVRLSVVAES